MATDTDLKITFAALVQRYRLSIAALIALYPAQAAWEQYYLSRIEEAHLVRIRRDVKTKLGVAFVKGEYALAFGEDVLVEGIVKTHVVRQCWSFRNDIATQVDTKHLEVIKVGR